MRMAAILPRSPVDSGESGLMNRRKSTLLAVFSAAALVLGSCSADKSDPPHDFPSAPVSTETPGPVTHDLEINEEARSGDSSFTITEAAVSTHCQHTGASVADGTVILTVVGTVELGAEEGEVLTSEPFAVDTREPKPVELRDASDCRAADDDRPTWDSVTEPGKPTEFFSAFTAPEEVTQLLISAGHETWRIEVSRQEAPEQRLNQPQPATTASAAPTLVECIYGGGSWTTNGRMSDGSFQWAPECQALHDQQMAANPYRCPQTDHYVPGPEHCGGGITAPPPEQQQQPSPWVQGQIDWTNCLEAGNTEEQCREMLNG